MICYVRYRKLALEHIKKYFFFLQKTKKYFSFQKLFPAGARNTNQNFVFLWKYYKVLFPVKGIKITLIFLPQHSQKEKPLKSTFFSKSITKLLFSGKSIEITLNCNQNILKTTTEKELFKRILFLPKSTFFFKNTEKYFSPSNALKLFGLFTRTF